MLNKVTKAECMEALAYLWGMGYTKEMTSDNRYYNEILCKAVANVLKLDLTELEED